MGLRERNLRTAMRETQRKALRLFRERGFTQVTVEEIAVSLGMAASTIFRHFGTKEAIIIWDEHDATLTRALTDRFRQRDQGRSPFHTIRDAFTDTFAQRYQADLEFELDRITFIYETPALHGAAVEAQLKDRDELTAALGQLLSKQHKRSAPLIAGAAMLALDVAIDQWQSHGGADNLGTLIAQAFDTLEHLSTLR